MRDTHDVTDEDLHKIAIGVGFYGRAHGNVAETDPHFLPDADCSGGGDGGTVETGSWSWWDLYENKIGTDGTGINGWTAYHYPEFGADLLHNPTDKMVISYTAPNSVKEIV